MFFFKRAQRGYTDFSAVGLDMHSHLIPGVDDGAKDVNDSLELIDGLRSMGFEHIITTPHSLQDIHPNTKDTLQAAHLSLSGQADIRLSSEYYLDDQFQQQLNANALLPFTGNRILIEFSQISRPFDLEEVIFDLGIKGYQVVLAHPERYNFFHSQFSYYNRLKEMGVELQLNALSLTDHYGKNIRSVAEKLVDKEMYDFFGTDIHHSRHLEALRRVPTTKHFAKLVDSETLKNQQLI